VWQLYVQSRCYLSCSICFYYFVMKKVSLLSFYQRRKHEKKVRCAHTTLCNNYVITGRINSFKIQRREIRASYMQRENLLQNTTLCIYVKPIVRNRVSKFLQKKNGLFWKGLGTENLWLFSPFLVGPLENIDVFCRKISNSAAKLFSSWLI